MTEEREESLSPHAVRSRNSHGRRRPEEPDPVRTAFQRDRDRIIHSNSFRRLKHKTQVFIAPLGDHYVTRLTHTLEVAQIARTIARALNLNEDLAEAIALGHDLGHTPFGHVGEDVLDELFPGGFRHNEQSLRVVDFLEKDGRGLNLTLEVRDGIVSHSKSGVDVLGKDWGGVDTLEGEVVKISDMVAYVNHDIGDAVRAGILTGSGLPAEVVDVLGQSHSRRINTMVSDIVLNSWDIRVCDIIKRPAIKMSPPVLAAANTLRDFLFEKVYNPRSAEKETRKAEAVVRFLYRYFNRYEDEMPPEYRLRDETTARRVVDYIAGMTDQFALRLAEELNK
ncbi:MAG: deoxyguanosinetriphosphate triphosphohydrolase [Chloroflexi bacterium RBG_16_56_11]|nr:MAG: deoxyguanosinetriphosphate triphosphohydrolase [Chloroflexi bacterium RBG_16_56_11]